MLELNCAQSRRHRHAFDSAKLSPTLKQHGDGGAPPKRPTALAPAPDGGPPGMVDQGKRLVGLGLMALHQKRHPHSYMNKCDKAIWNIQWMWVILVLLTAQSMFCLVNYSDDPITQRGIVWELIIYAKKKAAQIHSRFPRKPEDGDIG